MPPAVFQKSVLEGKVEGLEQAFASLSVFAVVTKTMSMPRIASTLS